MPRMPGRSPRVLPLLAECALTYPSYRRRRPIMRRWRRRWGSTTRSRLAGRRSGHLVWASTGSSAPGGRVSCGGESVSSLGVPRTSGSMPSMSTPVSSGYPTLAPVGRAKLFDPDFRFPRYLKASLGMDHRLPWDIVASADILYTRGVNQFYLDDLNLQGPAGTASGEAGRILYGGFDEDGTAIPNRRTAAFGQVIQIRNAHGDRTLTLSAQLQKRFGGGEVRLGYTHTSASDRLSASEEALSFDIAYTPLEGTLQDRRIATSLSSVPHKLMAVGAYDLPSHVRASLLYLGVSGPPFTYVLDGDANADGMAAPPFFVPNDIIYVPRDAGDIALSDPGQFGALDRYIRSEPCLESQRGRIMRRNSCRGGWSHVVNARLSRVFPTRSGPAVELTMDLFNALAIMKRDWGTQHRLT